MGATDRTAVVRRLAAAGCVAVREEAAELLAGAPDRPTLDAWLRRRERGEPLAWITGSSWFCGQRLHVPTGVYVPRAQSEELARRAARVLPERGRAVDLCTGVGAVAVHLRRHVPTAAVIGVDIDPRAAAGARRNGVPTMVADLGSALRRGEGVDLVTAVAPYVPTGQMGLLPADVARYEPRIALDGGVDGLDLVRRVVATAARLLRPDGWLFVEVGGGQGEALAPVLAEAGFGAVAPWWDEEGDLRGIAARATAPARGRSGR